MLISHPIRALNSVLLFLGLSFVPIAFLGSGASAQGLALTRVATFDAAAFQTPEGVWIDQHNNKFVSLALTGDIVEISADGSRSTIATLPLGPLLTACTGPEMTGYPAIVGNAYGDGAGNLFIGVNSCVPGRSGLWKVSIATGAMTMVASAPADTPNVLLNGTVVVGNAVLVTDSLHDLVWQAPVDGAGQPLKVWTDDPLLKAPPGPFPGPNGIAIFHHTAYVAVSATAQIIAVPILPDGSAGPASVHAQLSVGCDDFSFDVGGNIYCTSDPFQTVSRISPAGVETVLFTAADGLDGPTATYFGWGAEGQTLYITNGAVPFFPGTGHGPSLLKVDLGVEGYHLPVQENG